MKNADKVIVSVKEGKICGIKKLSKFSGIEYCSFLGVPYGQSTAGHSRFKDPVKVKPWKNILETTSGKDGCIQFSMSKQEIVGSEDCLYNNIHIPKIPQKDDPLKAVIVNIHPGALVNGTPDPDFYGSPEYIMHQDIVYVCIGYRLHILGFLNLGIPECSGNQGLKDIILSLQWIQENIQAFGGDPENVTILGSSSGATLVNDIMMSPRAKGLFHKVILMGMYKCCPTCIMKDEKENAQMAFELACNLGYEGVFDKKKLLSFYKKLDMENFIRLRPEHLYNEGNVPIFPASPFIPILDSGKTAVLPFPNIKHCLERTARVPLLIGFSEREAVQGFFWPLKPHTEKNFYKSIRQNIWGWGYHLTDDQLRLLQKEVESFYADGNSIKTFSESVKCDILTDASLSGVYDSLINIIAADLPSSVYVYKFQFEGNAATIKTSSLICLKEPLTGTYHLEDFSNWAHLKNIGRKKTDSLTPKTREMIDTFTKLVSTFAKTGNPNYEGISVQWKPCTVEEPRYMSINDTLQMVDGKLNGKRMEFWESLKRKFEKGEE